MQPQSAVTFVTGCDSIRLQSFSSHSHLTFKHYPWVSLLLIYEKHSMVDVPQRWKLCLMHFFTQGFGILPQFLPYVLNFLLFEQYPCWHQLGVNPGIYCEGSVTSHHHYYQQTVNHNHAACLINTFGDDCSNHQSAPLGHRMEMTSTSSSQVVGGHWPKG